MVVWALLAACFTLVQVRQSLSYGRLEALPTYDDISYLRDAQARLDVFYAEGPFAAFLEFFQQPPHSPWSTALAMFAFSIFGLRDWAPAAANGIIVFAILAWLSLRSRKVSVGWQLAIGLYVLTWPLSGQAVVNFRPDIAAGLATAATALFITLDPWLGAKARRHYRAGAGLALAILIKPTFGTISILIILSALTAASRDSAGERDLEDVLPASVKQQHRTTLLRRRRRLLSIDLDRDDAFVREGEGDRGPAIDE